MSRRQTDVFVCDRCGLTEPPRELRNAEDDEGFPLSWFRATLRGDGLNVEKDLCFGCAAAVGQVLAKLT